MENLTYVTGNYGKYISVKDHFEKNGIAISYYKCDLPEPEVNDIKFISHEKARLAYGVVGTPVFVADSGFYIEAYPDNPGYPGAFVKRSGISSNINELLELMTDVSNRNCYFLDCLTFYNGTDYYQFFGISRGSLSYVPKGNQRAKAKSNLWYVFIPNNCTKTLAEMTDKERYTRNDNHTSATDEFITWYKNNYLNNKTLTKSKKIK